MNQISRSLCVVPPSAAVDVGVGRRDMTPPVGIYSRMWGAAKHDTSTGTHRPLCATALVIRQHFRGPALALVSLDLAVLKGGEDEKCVRQPIIDLLGGDPPRVLVNLTHTHGVPWTSTTRASLPGGHLIRPFMGQVAGAALEAVREALQNCRPAVITFATGKCDLATNRDLPEPKPGSSTGRGRRGRIVCGFNPAKKADDTLLTARVACAKTGRTIATLVNYACHPTTLAWENKLISPDFVGSMRELVESHTGGAPCLFLQGASGELAPAWQYSGDPALADTHGRRLGHSVLATLEGMLPPAHALALDRVVESGAPLAVWRPRKFSPPSTVRAVAFDTPLPLKKMPSEAELLERCEACKDRALKERLFRKLQIVRELGHGKVSPTPAWVWRVGQALFFAHGNEAYSDFQLELRRAFPDYACVVMNVTNGGQGYLPPPGLYGQDIYQVWQTPYERDGLPGLLRACKRQARKLIRGKR